MSIQTPPRPESGGAPPPSSPPPSVAAPAPTSSPARAPSRADHRLGGLSRVCPTCRSLRRDVRRVVDTTDRGTHLVRVLCSDAWHGGIDPVVRRR